MTTEIMLMRQMPKEEIGATAFLRQHGECDGRGVLVAVFDTGVDPGAAGLQICPDGRPKLVDVIDCTGAGDVDTSTAATPAADGTLKGLSGRTLKIPPAWPAPKTDGGTYHLGLKHVFELYPRGLAGRVKTERRKTLDAAQRDAVAASQAAMLTDEKKKDKRWSDEMKSRVSLLEKLEAEYEDPGPLYDVLTYVDCKGGWHVCVDTSEQGDLASCTLLEPFRVGHRSASLIATDCGD